MIEASLEITAKGEATISEWTPEEPSRELAAAGEERQDFEWGFAAYHDDDTPEGFLMLRAGFHHLANAETKRRFHATARMAIDRDEIATLRNFLTFFLESHDGRHGRIGNGT